MTSLAEHCRLACELLMPELVRGSEPETNPEAEADHELQQEQTPMLDQETEELLKDTLYCVGTLMGDSGEWPVSSAPAGMANCVPGRKISNVSCQTIRTTVPQVLDSLRATFSTDQETIERLRLQVHQRKPAALTLHLTVKEAKVHCQRSAKGSTNTFVTVTVPGGMDHRTRTVKGTHYPKWMEKFDLLINDPRSDHLRLELWQEVEEEDSRSQRIYRKIVHSSPKYPVLLGSLTLSLREIALSHIDGWYLLKDLSELDEEDEENCSTKMYLSGSVSSVADIKNTHPQSHSILVKYVLDHVVHSDSDTVDSQSASKLWSGRVPEGIAAVIAQHALMLSLSIEAQQLIWWCVASQEVYVDNTWLLSQLKSVQSSLVRDLYSSEEQVELSSSLCQFQSKCIKQIKDLNSHFPVSSRHSKYQLPSMLNVLQSLETHPKTQHLLHQEKQPLIRQEVIKAIEQYAEQWWTRQAQKMQEKSTTVDDQLGATLSITEEVLIFLEHASQFYDAAFMKEMNICALMYMYQSAVGSLVECLQPVISEILKNSASQHLSENSHHTPQCDFKCGSSLWKVYKNLMRIAEIELNLPLRGKTRTGVDKYYQWFIPAVQNWLHSTNQLTYTQVWEAVQKDSFTPVDSYNGFSQSSIETTAIFHSVKVWWHMLSWPDSDSHIQFLQKILENLYSLCVYYVDTLCQRAGDMLEVTSKGLLICQKVCVGVQNVEHVQKEMMRLRDIFIFESHIDEICKAGNTCLASQIKANMDSMTESKMHDMKIKTEALRNTIICKMKPTLENSLDDACECNSSSPLLEEVLDPSIGILSKGLKDDLFQDYLWNFWEFIVMVITTTVANNSKRDTTYFETLYQILQGTFKFFTPSSRGLDHTKAKSPEYISLLNDLEFMKMNTDALIAHYYHERWKEQNQEILPKKGLLFIRAFFRDSDHLVVRVIMARDVVVNDEKSGNLPLEYFVQVKLQPEAWFSKPLKSRTKVLKEDPATFDEEFEFDISTSGRHLQEGVLLLTLKDKNKIHVDTVLGEAFVILSSISPNVSDVKNMSLQMSLPSTDSSYKSLQVLQNRLTDNTARYFLKKLSRHHPALHLKRNRIICS